MYRRGARRWRKLYRVNGHLFQAKRFSRVCTDCRANLAVNRTLWPAISRTAMDFLRNDSRKQKTKPLKRAMTGDWAMRMSVSEKGSDLMSHDCDEQQQGVQFVLFWWLSWCCFLQRASCAYCSDRIWGLGRQGYKCINCKLLVHKKCHKLIKITCGMTMVGKATCWQNFTLT